MPAAADNTQQRTIGRSRTIPHDLAEFGFPKIASLKVGGAAWWGVDAPPCCRTCGASPHSSAGLGP
eukprot:13977432-Alexandrium_andersonii.AAC.1